MLNRRLLRNFDLTLFVAMMIIIAMGLTAVGSATRSSPVRGDSLYYVKRQLLWLVLALVAMAAMMAVDYNELGRAAWLIYIANLGLLAGVLVVGRTAMGATRWIQLGPLPLQPSEVGKVLIILSVGNLLRRREKPIADWLDFVPPLLHVGVPVLLILKQPDLGTALTFVAILVGMLFLAGARLRRLLLLCGAGLVMVVGLLFMQVHFGFPRLLQDYQLKRLIVFVDPGADPLGVGYHIIQSKIAIGSGGLLGKGLFHGTQNQLNFIPEQHTDFIFSVIGEELGFLGATVLLVCYFIMIWRGISIVANAKDFYGVLVGGGVVTMFAFHLVVNVGMTAGIMPVTGIPLPLVSYGGSSLITSLASLGLLQNISMRRQKILF